MFARLFLLINIAVGLVAGRAMPMQDCVRPSCDCCTEASLCCSMSETRDAQPSPLAFADGSTVDLKMVAVPLVEGLTSPAVLAIEAPIFVPEKPTRLPSSARLDLICIRLI